MDQNKIIIYQTEDGQTQIDVRMENETVWLTQAQMVELFQTTKQNVSLHVGNVFKEGELEENSTVKEYLTIQKEGKREVNRKVKYYNLDVIISVGYRVKNKRGTAFRIWARNILKEYLVRGYAVNQRIHSEQIAELRQLVQMVGRTIQNQPSSLCGISSEVVLSSATRRTTLSKVASGRYTRHSAARSSIPVWRRRQPCSSILSQRTTRSATATNVLPLRYSCGFSITTASFIVLTAQSDSRTTPL